MKACQFFVLSFLLSFVAHGQVPFDRLVQADKEPESWLTYSGNYSGHRFSNLNQITKSNVKDLKVAWVYQLPDGGYVETSPIVVDGIMYITEPPATVSALDAKSGRRIWSTKRPMPEDLNLIGFPPVNRGVAILDDTLYVGTLDCYIVALDRETGAKRWETKVEDNYKGYSITVAPLAIEGKIIVGVSGGEAGIRGFLDAYDAKTGELLWRTFTIPGEGEFGNDTWSDDSWKTGAAPTWVTGSYDPELNLLYWGTGNPGPDWNGDVRLGDNLYSCSVLALNPDTGKLQWYFQFTPHDVHDWDSNQIPVLIDGEVDGQKRKLFVTANRNAFYYVLDRETGKFIRGAPYAKQTWAEGLGESGRPILIPGKEPTKEGNLVYPSLQGATNWFSPSYSPKNNTFYVSVREMGSYYYKSDVEFEEGKPFMGGGEKALRGDKAHGAIRALDALTGKQKWEFILQSPPWSGVMATAGGLVFGGSMEGNFFALDADSGVPLWEIQTGGRIAANPIGFALDGKQHVAIAAGQSIFVFGL
jgi:alcohol dehydrogenase (cytochrome c)